ncbi:hypothetical protein E2562_035515 [Oryza meyeriana var. granulata]|uniref:Uncharacterized protein n=1 Tax=Oryza meyeriana var. granulata TaxID=110450 RepID=A0A6G1DB52_9ORYZ|nr:hypothetical protein E2562_035515 [Oryza meyeriana var. granulata]
MGFGRLGATTAREVIADALHKCLQSYDLDCRVSIVTLDNCSTNDSMVGVMETKIGAANLLLEGEDGGHDKFESFWTCLEDNEEDMKEPCITSTDSD